MEGAGCYATPDLDPWLRRDLNRLAPQETDVRELIRGDALLHTDIRSDNFLLTPDGGVVFLDWAWACNGAPWLDLVLFAMTVNAEGGANAELLVRGHPLTRDITPSCIDAILLVMAGNFRWVSRSPEPPSLPGIRYGVPLVRTANPATLVVAVLASPPGGRLAGEAPTGRRQARYKTKKAWPAGASIAEPHREIRCFSTLAYELYNPYMVPISISEAREGLAEIVNRVAYGHERVVLGRRGRALVALIPAEDLELLEQLEDAADLRGAIEALADPENQGPPVTLAELRARIAEREGRQVPRE